jgi:hypothetical protein
MSAFIFPHNDDANEHPEFDPLREQGREKLREVINAMQASFKAAEVDYQRNTRANKARGSVSICLRMPVSLIKRLDAVAASAATSRSHLLRQMAADYLNSMEDAGIRFSGCLLSVDKIKKQTRQ